MQGFYAPKFSLIKYHFSHDVLLVPNRNQVMGQNISTLQKKQIDRIDCLDAIRGLAIFGILLVNGPALNGPAVKDGADFAFQNSYWDLIYTKFIFSFAVNNFYPIFACLFGLSAAIFMSTKHVEFAQKLHLRRMFLLTIFGLLQIVFIWWGDILLVYGLMGFFLTLLFWLSPKQIRNLFVAFIVLAICLSLSYYYLHNPQPVFNTTKDLLIYSHGSFYEITRQRISDFIAIYWPGQFFSLDWFQIIDYLIFYVQLAICFLLGYWIFVSGWLYCLISQENIAKRTLLISFTLTFVIAIISESFWVIGEALFLLKGISRGIFYASLIVYLYHFSWWRKVLYPFSLVGKMSLSNYIFHNLLLSLIFYGYGLGLFGRIGPFLQAPILLGLMLLSILLSSIWLKYFKWGPLEWLWRAATLGSFPSPFKNTERAKGFA